MSTHEAFVNSVACLAKARLAPDQCSKLDAIKLVYGAGQSGLRGVTYFNRWNVPGEAQSAAPFVEVCAFGQSSWVQLAGTTIHELAHVLAGWEAGHGPAWKAACEALGLRCAKAAGTEYRLASFTQSLRMAIAALPLPNEGEPVRELGAQIGFAAFKPCGAGTGTRGGKSRGKGSGSRLRLWQCDCGVKARVACDTFEARHLPCGSTFQRI